MRKMCFSWFKPSEMFVVGAVKSDENWVLYVKEDGLVSCVQFNRDHNICSCEKFTYWGGVCRHMFFVISTVMNKPFIAREIRRQDNNMPAYMYIKNFDGLLENGLSPCECVLKEEGQECDECPICFDVMKKGDRVFVCQKTCKRKFHHTCIHRYMVYNTPFNLFQCPTCRTTYSSQNISSTPPKYLKMFKGITVL